MWNFCGSVVFHRNDWTWCTLVNGLVIMIQHCDCKAQASALKAIVRQMDIHMRNSCEALAEQAQDSVIYKNLGSDGRKHRIDEDFKKDCVETFLKKRKVTHIGATVKCWAGLTSQSCARKWADKYVIERNLASRTNIQVRRVLGVTEDAAKNGNPKEETNVYVVYDPNAKEATFGALQVSTFTFFFNPQ